jgi:hypothetical protein
MAELTFTRIDKPDGEKAADAPITFTPVPPVEPPSFMSGVGTGLMDKVYGAAQLGAHLAPPDEATGAPLDTQALDERVRAREKTLESEGYNKGWGRTVGNVVGDIGLTAPLSFIPGGAPATFLARAAQGARLGAAGGGIAGATQPVTGENYAGEKAGQIALSAGGGAALGGAGGALASAIAKDTPEALESFIRDNFRRSVKPTVAGKGTAADVRSYDGKMASAIDSIVANKANLKFVDEAGQPIAGQLPKTLDQFSQAIEQTRRSIFEQYDALAQQAGAAGAKVDVAPIVAELDKLKATIPVQDFSPEVISYIDGISQRMGARGGFTATEAQDAIQHLNQTLQTFYRNPTQEMVSKAPVNALIANKLREALDEVIENTAGAGYQALKNQYGALKAIEKDVVKRAIVTSREPQGGGIIDRLANIGTAAEVVHAVTNPKALLTAAAIKGTQMGTRWLKSPNRAVTRLFDAAERKPAAPASSLPVTQFAAPPLGAIGGDAATNAMGLQ